MIDNPVYTDAEVYIIPSGHGPNINYRVCFGYVDWRRDGNLRPAIYILMEYQGKTNYQIPPHILTSPGPDGVSDFIKVMDKIAVLRDKFKIS